MIDFEMLDPSTEHSLTFDQIDRICQDITSDNLLFRKYIELHVNTSERSELIDPSWKHKMETLGREIQKIMN